MKSEIKSFAGAFCLVFLVVFSARAAKTGSNYKDAVEIGVGKEKTVSLTPEYDVDFEYDPDDPDYKGYDEDSGVYFFKFTAKEGSSFTVTATGGSESDPIDLDVSDKSSYDFDSEMYVPWFDTTVDSDGLSYRSILPREAWIDDEYDSKGVYYIKVSGTPYRSVSVKLLSGEVVEPIPQGSEENPKTISASQGKVKKESGNFVDNSYYYSMSLEAGRAYLFGTIGGTEDNLLKLEFDEGELKEGPSYYDYSEWMDDYNDACYLVAGATGKHLVIVSSDSGGNFELRHTMLAALAPEKHKGVLELPEPTSEGVSLQVKPGRRHAQGSSYFDAIIDEDLAKASLKAGKYYVFAVEGANSNLCLEVYAKGADSASASVSDVSDPVLAFSPPSDGDYWVGVCQKLYDDINPSQDAAYEECTLTARVMKKGEGMVDAWDTEDDVYSGASGLAPAPGGKDDDPVESGSAHGTSESPHWLGATDWVDTYMIAARKGLVYKLRTSFAETPDFDSSKWKLSGVVYTMSKNKRKDVATIEDLESGGEFTASASEAYFVEVSVAKGQGRDYGPYILHSLAYDSKGRDLGTLTVNIAGATYAKDGAAWYVASDGAKNYPTYPGGSSVLLPAGSDTVKLVKVSGWTADPNAAVTIKKGAVTEVGLKYSDLMDHGDDVYGGAVELKPSSKVETISRSLWSDDPADWFKFSAEPGSHYSFSLQESSKLGDAKIEVLASDRKSVIVEGTEASFLYKATAKATYWLRVVHSTAAKTDSQYVMEYSRSQVGVVAFDKDSYSAKDSAASVSLKVKRTSGKEGVVRVRYTTVAETAVPGTHYYPQTNVLVWAAGDSKDKTIAIKLIPDLVAHYEQSRSFKVFMAALPDEDLASDEVAPMISRAVATVTIADSSMQSPGTVSFAAWGDDDSEFANAKKPVASVRAGYPLRLRLDRTGGSDGEIGVTVTPKKGSAVPDVNYVEEAQTLVWADGDSEPKYFTLATLDTGAEYQSAKSLTLNLSSDKTMPSSAKKLGSAVTVTIGDAQATGSLSDYSGGFAKTDGIAFKESKTDAWYFDAAGELVNAPLSAGGKAQLTLTLTGPGKFACRPTFADGGSGSDVCTIAVGKEKAVAVTSEGLDVVRYIPKGSTKVTFTISRAQKGSSESPSLSFADMGDGQPFLWKVLPTPTLVAPLASERPIADCDDKVKLMWSDAEDSEIVYLFYLDENKKKLGTSEARFSAEGEELSCEYEPLREIRVHCDDCGGMAMDDEIYARKTYYWRVDTAFVEDGKVMLRNSSAPAWTIYALPCEDTPSVAIVGGVDSSGASVSSIEPEGSVVPVELVQGVSARIELGSEGGLAGGTDVFSLSKGAKLPAGMSLKGSKIVGAPTKAGEFSTVIQLSRKFGSGKSATTIEGGTIAFRFTVVSPALAAGSFSGLLGTDDKAVTTASGGIVSSMAAMKLGSLSVTAAAGGKISASVSVGGKAYKFSSPCWGGILAALDNGQPGVTVSITNNMKFTVAKKPVTAPAVLTLTACRGSEDDTEALDTPMTATLEMPFLLGGSLTKALWSGLARRNNAKVSAALAGVADFAGYYTVALSPTSAPDYYGGHGYVTVTVNAKKSTAKVAGVLADGSTKISASAAVASCVSEGEDGMPEIVIPIYYGKGSVSFGGWLRIKSTEDGSPVVASDSRLEWINASASATYSGKQGFIIGIEPTGGYYDTVKNLQTYYLDSDLYISDVGEDSLPDELLGANQCYVCRPGMYDDGLSVSGNAISVPKQKKRMRSDNKKLLDWGETVNPANVSFSFKRATGVYSGKFEIWAGNAEAGTESKQVKLGTFNHQGVLLLARDPSAVALPAGDTEVIAPGSFKVPVKVTSKRTWNAALPFEIIRASVVNDWDIEWL